jgi:RING finger protein 113A
MEESMPNVAAPMGVTFTKRRAKARANIRKGQATAPSSTSDDSPDYSSSENASRSRIKRRKKNTGVVMSSSNDDTRNTDNLATNLNADCNVSITCANDAMKQNSQSNADSKTAQIPSKAYKGLANHASFIHKPASAPTGSFGPTKAPSSIRTTTITDFAPDVCKDYKQTGFCGFGDTCKFAHDRSDFKQGWQLDREWENMTKSKKVGGRVVANINKNKMAEEDEDTDSIPEDIPFACIICKRPYRNPIVTRCGHYFCESCALRRYRKDPSCAACGSGTNGVFNSSQRLKMLLEKKTERVAKNMRKAVEAGEEIGRENDK